MTVRVVVVDDQELMRTGFRMILDAESDIEVVGEAADGREAIDVVARLRPDVVLMDVRMPNLDGIEATRRIVTQGDELKVLILTTFDLDEYVFAAVRAGCKRVPAQGHARRRARQGGAGRGRRPSPLVAPDHP